MRRLTSYGRRRERIVILRAVITAPEDKLSPWPFIGIGVVAVCLIMIAGMSGYLISAAN